MPGCVLHASGDDFDVDTFLSGSSLHPYRVHRRGELRRQREPFPDSGLSFNISDADGDLTEEVDDAIKFLAAHELEIQRLGKFPGVTDLRLDFGYYKRDVIAQFDYLPPELVRQAGHLGIGIELSLYPVSLPETIEA